jgi:hypothetical protein
MHGLKFGILPDATDQRLTKARKSSVEQSNGRCFLNFAGRFNMPFIVAAFEFRGVT